MEGKSLRSLEQRRASFAWKKAGSVPMEKRKEYTSWVKKLPAMIMTNGLGQTMAFLKSKSKEDEGQQGMYDLLYKHISEWLTSDADIPLAWHNEVKQKSDIIERIVHECTGSIIYRQAAQEALALISWLKRFAEALPTEKKEEPGKVYEKDTSTEKSKGT